MNEQLPVPTGHQLRLPAERPVQSTELAPVGDRIRHGFAALRRRWPWFALVFVAVLGAIAVYTYTRTTEFTASATVLVNSRILNVTAKADSVIPDASDEDRAVNSEIQVLQSNDVIRGAVAALKAGPLPRIEELLTELPPATAPAATLETVRGHIRIDRPGNTNVLQVSYTATDPVIAASVANALVRQYIASKGEVRVGAARAADASLRKELDTLRGKVEGAEQEVADYRRKNNLLSADGVTLTERDQSLFRQQEAASETALAEERARYSTARSQLSRGSNGDDVGEALSSSVVSGLRGQRAVAAAALAQLEARYQPDHPSVVRARREVSEIDAAIKTEIGRVVSNLRARVDVAQQRAGVASGILGQARGELASNAGAAVRLNELERRADALRTNYAGLLARQTVLASQAVVADVDARLLSSALTPKRPSAPNRKLNLALGTLLALLLASGVVALLQLFDQRIISSNDVETRIGLPHLVNMPSVASIATRADRRIPPVDFVVDRPMSMIAESMRSLLLSIERNSHGTGPRIVGIASARPGEGKTTLAVCLARVAAISGRRTLLIDGDIRRPRVAQMLGLTPKVGLVDVLSGEWPLKDAVLQDERSGAWVLPTMARPYKHAQINSEEALRLLMSRLVEFFDLVIIDTAPSMMAVESRLLMSHVEQTILAVRWRHTRVSAVRNALHRLRSIGVDPVGVVTTQVDMKAVAAYAIDDVDHEYRRWEGFYA